MDPKVLERLRHYRRKQLLGESFGYTLAMRVMQSDLYPHLEPQARAECDELIRRGQELKE